MANSSRQAQAAGLQRAKGAGKAQDAQWALHIEHLIQSRHFDVAEELLDAEMRLRPSRVDAQRLSLMLALTRADQPLEAVRRGARLIKLAPAVASHHWLYGLAHKLAGNPAAAIKAYRTALAIDAKQPGVWVSLGIVHRAQGQFDEAIRCYRRALRLAPQLAEAHTNLGNALAERERQSDPLAPPSIVPESIAAQRRALELDPANAAVAANLATALEHAGQLDEAITLFNQALGADPERQDWLLRLGGCLAKQRQSAAVVALYDQWMKTHPDSGVIASNLALALLETNELDRALEWSEKAVAFDEGFGGAHLSRASALLRACEAEEAIASYKKALTLSPQHHANARSGLLMSLNYVEEDPQVLLDTHRDFGLQYPAPGATRVRTASRHGRRVRIGYVSGDFKQHSVAWFFESLIENHDRAAFDVVCYHNTFAADAVTARIKARASEWVECFNLTDQALAERIRDDRIDIVIDLSGHTHGHRLAALASQPAPLQMTYLGYPTTTGLAAIDYRITDAVIDPPALGNLNVETPLRLAASMFCYRPDTAPETGLPPFLQRGHMTFGSFNNGTKLSRRTLALWARVLNQVAGSTLFIKSQALAQESVRARLKKRMQDAGIDPQRVRFDPWRPDKASHLELYREVDIGLDTFPYNGATTTCEALWMGVPVITLSGTTHVSRMGASILAGAEHPEWVAADAEQFVAIATALAAQPDEIVRFRQQARTQLPRTPLMDGQRFTQDFEQQLLRAWDARVEGATA